MTGVQTCALPICFPVTISWKLGDGRWKMEGKEYAWLKTSKKGIISAIILGFARAVGDTMIALMIAGNSLQIPNSILDSARTLTSHIALINASDYESTAFKAIFLCGLLLLVFSFLTVVSLKLINKEAR